MHLRKEKLCKIFEYFEANWLLQYVGNFLLLLDCFVQSSFALNKFSRFRIFMGDLFNNDGSSPFGHDGNIWISGETLLSLPLDLSQQLLAFIIKCQVLQFHALCKCHLVKQSLCKDASWCLLFL